MTPLQRSFRPELVHESSEFHSEERAAASQNPGDPCRSACIPEKLGLAEGRIGTAGHDAKSRRDSRLRTADRATLLRMPHSPAKM